MLIEALLLANGLQSGAQGAVEALQNQAGNRDFMPR
jgi:hypothetical protein